MRALFYIFFLLTPVYAFGLGDTLVHKAEPRPDKLIITFYSRAIRNASNGALRIDENLVANTALTGWLRLEAGYRHGETRETLGAYDHYKIELQTKSFFRIVRVFARMSDRLVRSPQPKYSNSNYIFVAEARYRFAKDVMAIGGVGFVSSYQKDNEIESLPLVSGIRNNMPTYKMALRYSLHEKGFLEGSFGAYDVFNPYAVNSPFTQVTLDHELTQHLGLYSYFRHQFSLQGGKALNDFLCLGLAWRPY